MVIISDREMAEHRADALSRMTSTCTIRRNAGRTEPDPTTGAAPVEWIEVYAGPCRIGGIGQRGAAAGGASNRPGGQEQVASRTLHLPHGTTGIPDGAVAVIESGDLAGTFWVVGESAGSDQTTALSLPVTSCTRPPDWP